MEKGNEAFLGVDVPITAIFLPHGNYTVPDGHDELLVALEKSLNAEMVNEFSVLEVLENECREQDEEEVGLHLHQLQHDVEVSLDQLN